MDPEAVFTRYDIRGDHPEEIDAEFAERLGRAVGTYARQEDRGQVVVGRDTREASEAVRDPFIAGVRAAGANVVDVGVGPTDRTALAAEHFGGVGAMITASHHSWDRTGFKLLYERGNGFTNQDLDRVRDLFRSEEFETGEGTLIREQHEFDEEYMERAEKVFRDMADGIDATVVVDPAGAAGRTAPLLFEELGAEVVEHEWSERPDPEPAEGNRAAVRATMERDDADLAVGYDPDADRVYLFHPDIGWVDGDRLFHAMAQIVEPERVVASIDTAPMLEELDIDISYTRVGDVFVAEEGVERDADLLGEPNGHYAVPAFSWYNSGVFCSLLLAAHADDLPALLEPVKDHRTERFVTEFDTMNERDHAMREVKKRVAERYDVVSRVDGVKFAGDGVVALARPSGTSPKIRLVVHGRKGDDLGAVRDQVLG